MLLPIRPICNRKKVRRDGTSLIQIQYCYSSEKKTLLNTGIAIPPNYWVKKRLCISDNLPTTYGNPGQLNTELKRMLRVAEDIIEEGLKDKISDPVSFLKKIFTPDFDLIDIAKLREQKPEKSNINLDFYFQIDDYIESKRKQVSPKMINVYRNMKNTLKAFEEYRKKPITFDSLDYNFYEEFVDYMMYEHIHRRRKEIIKGFKISNIGKIIKQLRIFIRNRIRKKIIPPINLEDFKILDEESDAIYLNMEEIRHIHLLDLSEHPHLEKYRDLLVFGCLTGLRFSDFSIINSEDVRGKMLYKKQGKSDQWVVIPLRDEANYIFDKKFSRNIPLISNPDFNYYIKEVGKFAGITEKIKFSHKKGNRDIITVKPKFAWITSHTCRRSFCTNEFLAGTPVELIMKISGHKSLRDFYKYIRITPEEAGRKIKELWEQRGDLGILKKEGIKEAV